MTSGWIPAWEPQAYRLRSCSGGYRLRRPSPPPRPQGCRARRTVLLHRSHTGCGTSCLGQGGATIEGCIPGEGSRNLSETTCDAMRPARRLYKTQIVGTYRAGTPFGEFDEIECGDIG